MASADASSAKHEHSYSLKSAGHMECSCGKKMKYSEWERMWSDIGGKED